MQQVVSCTNCGAPNASNQQFCTTCGSRLARAASQQVSPEPQTFPGTATAQFKREVVSQRYQMLGIVAPVFKIVGWVVLAGGSLGSLLVALLMSQGALAQLAGFLGNVAEVLGLGAMAAAVPLMIIAIGVTGSLLAGLGMLAFADLCTAVGDIEERSSAKQ